MQNKLQSDSFLVKWKTSLRVKMVNFYVSNDDMRGNFYLEFYWSDRDVTQFVIRIVFLFTTNQILKIAQF